MKKIVLLSIILPLLAGCGEEEQLKSCYESKICGEWSLILYRRGFSPTQKFNEGDILWSISPHKIEVDINVPLDNRYFIPFKTAGEYPTKINLHSGKILVGRTEHDFSFEREDDNDRLHIFHNPESDGPLIKFTKHVKNKIHEK